MAKKEQSLFDKHFDKYAEGKVAPWTFHIIAAIILLAGELDKILKVTQDS